MASRRHAIVFVICAIGAWGEPTAAPVARGQAGALRPACGGGVLDVSLPRLVASANLEIRGPVSRSEAGLPLGNGRMGTLLWTTPTALHMQINRVDVFGNNKDSNSFPERHTDYCGGCAFIDVDVGDDVFGAAMSQTLSCHNGLAEIRGEGVRVRAIACVSDDAIAVEVTDERSDPKPVRISLRMLRPAAVRHFRQTATSAFETRGDRLVLTQAFDEADYHCGSAVAVGATGRSARVEPTSAEAMSLIVDAGKGPVLVTVSSAASFDRNSRLADAAVALVEAAADRPFAELLAANQAWWRDFWSRGFVWLHSADAAADAVQLHYYYYLYLMASTSRGRYPTKFNGMLWTTGGDCRQWGGQYWGANQSCLYNALLPTNRFELLDPMFDMYTGMYDSCATAAIQQWGSRGVFIPETHAFDGLATLPEDIAAEMRELYLVRKPMTAASARFLEYARMKQPHSSRWNWQESGRIEGGQWQPRQRPEAPFGAVTHIFSRGAKIAYMFWQRYEFTQDKTWLRDRAYPMLRGVAEFYRNFPNTRRGADGKYHIDHVNSNESVRDASDTDEEIAAMRGIFPALIRASQILNVDADMRPKWQEFLDNLAPLPRSNMPEVIAMQQARGRDGRRGGERRDSNGKDDNAPHWVRGLPPIRSGGGAGRPDGNTMPMWFFDLCTLENPDAETMRVANATLGDGRGGGVLSKMTVTSAMMGRADAVRTMLPRQIASPDRAPVMENRMDLREGPQTTSAQRLGRAADALHNALVQSVGAGPAADPVVRVFPAWPERWDAAFTLLCRGGFLVTSSMRAGRVEFIAIEAQVGGPCRVRNPWKDSAVSLRRDNGVAEELRGDLLSFETAPRDRVTLAPSDAALEKLQRSIPPAP